MMSAQRRRGDGEHLSTTTRPASAASGRAADSEMVGD